MKKNHFDIKGFAMSELLAASIVILLLFSILFANYLPLVSEFENRILYTNVTANYGAFYVRKIYRTALENDNVKQTLDQGLTTKSYYTVYKKSDSNQIELVSGNLENQLRSIINEYNIEEIIITNYKLDNLKGRNQSSNSPERYKKNSGLLYNYINYLPFYTLSKYGGRVSEPYRIIMKTQSGFATTQILPNPQTPINCFDFDNNSLNTGQFIITNYHEECGPIVNITSDEITVGNGSTAKKGIITSITGTKTETGTEVGAFEDKGIESVNLSGEITSIGDRAFMNNNIAKFSFEDNAPSVKSIGNNAFSNNKLTKITIPDTLINIGQGAFSNNYSLKIIEFNYNNITQDKVIPKKMFALDYDTSKLKNNLIDLFIPANITNIGEGAFKNIQLSSIEFENRLDYEEDNEEESQLNPSNLKTIGTSAFELDDRLFDLYPANYVRVSIPHTVERIYPNAFKNIKIGELILQTNKSSDEKENSKLTSIGNSAFQVKETDETKIEKENFCDSTSSDESESENTCEYTRNVKIPVSVTSIGENAFQNQALSAIVFDNLDDNGVTIQDSLLKTIGNEAFSGNKFKMFVIPKNLTTASAVIGSKIFGNNYTLGNSLGDIYIEMDLSTDQNWHNKWCNAFYGNPCTDPVAKYNSPEEDEGIDNNTMIYKNGSTTKYITYVDSE